MPRSYYGLGTQPVTSRSVQPTRVKHITQRNACWQHRASQQRQGVRLGVAGVDELSSAPSPSPAPASKRATTPSYQLLEVRGLDVSTVLVRDGEHAGSKGTAAQGVASISPTRIVASVKSLFLPDGYPNSTTPDYVPYQLWATPTHVLGSVAHALTTSSLLQAVGVSAGPVTTTAASAAIKWITKNGIGALGRFVVGGSLAQEFDRDPRRWRMIAEFCTATGAGLEIATAAFPQHFLLLASTGHFAKALGKAIGKPVFRVIQTHFARDNNVGAVAAKEEVWEVVAQLSGYALSVAVLSAVDELVVKQGGVSTGTELVAIWAGVQGTHAFLRYKSLRTLQFSSLNEKRLRLLAADHVAGRPLQAIAAVNLLEPVMLPASLSMTPPIKIGTCSMTELLTAAATSLGYESHHHHNHGINGSATKPVVNGHSNGVNGHSNGHSNGHTSPATAHNGHAEGVHVLGVKGSAANPPAPREYSNSTLQQVADALLDVYADEGHVLVWPGHGQGAVVMLRDGAPSTVLSRVMWQVYWLERHVAAGQPAGLRELNMSVQALQAEFPLFEAEAVQQGWDVSSVLMSTGVVRFKTE